MSRKAARRAVQPSQPPRRQELVLKPDAKPADDLRALELVETAGVMPPVCRLTFSQLQEIERLSALRVPLAMIGVRLLFSPEMWREIVRNNPDVRACVYQGHARAVEEHAEALRDSALVQGDVGAQRFWLERHGGPEWVNKPQKVVVTPELPVGIAATIDVLDSVGEALENQRKLLESDLLENYADSVDNNQVD